jgi:hypothetical protein
MNQSDVRWLDPKMKLALPIIEQVFRQCAPAGFAVELTAGREWFHHAMWSLHHSGNAVDIRTRTLPDGGLGNQSARIATVLQQVLDVRFGRGSYTVLRNDAGPTKPHIHVQYNLGGRWSQPGDFKTKSTRIA